MEDHQEVIRLAPIVTLLAIVTTVSAVVVAYRLTLHPLAGFPGPKLAAATKWYEFYFDVLTGEGGQYYKKIDHMHERYGPVVRINPEEIHVNNPEWFDIIYTGGTNTRHKYGPAAQMSGVTMGTHGTVNHDIHRMRRAAISPLFAKTAVYKAADLIQGHAERLCDRIKQQSDDRGCADLKVLLGAYGNDVITAYLFGGTKSASGMLGDYSAAEGWEKTTSSVAGFTPLVKQFPWLISYVKLLPRSLLASISANMTSIIRLDDELTAQAKTSINTKNRKSGAERPLLFDKILSSDIPDHEKEAPRMGEEGFVVQAAAGETIARVLCSTIYHLSNCPEVLKQLRDELAQHPNCSIDELENLPLMSATIKEGLRVSAVFSSRLPLVAAEPLIFGRWTVPPGTGVSMSLGSLLYDPVVYPKPAEFQPRRWLDCSDEQRSAMNKYFVPFSRGSRGCLGTNFAYAELFVVLAAILRRFDFSLFDLDVERDIVIRRDCFLGEPSKASRGLRITVVDRV